MNRIISTLLPWVGLTLGILCALGSVLIAGAGHGWDSALPFGLLALVLTPLAFYRLAHARTPAAQPVKGLLAAAVILNTMLLVSTLSEGVHYFVKVLPMAALWLVLWFSWQIAALAAWHERPR